MKFRAFNFDYQLEASAHVESTRKTRDVLFIRQASQVSGHENFEPTSTTPVGAAKAKKPGSQTVDGLSEQSVCLPLQRVCIQETAKKGMAELQFKNFMDKIASVAITKRIASCPWGDLEQRTSFPTQFDPSTLQLEPDSSTETMEPFYVDEEGLHGEQEPDTRSEVSCRAIVPYRYQHVDEKIPRQGAHAIDPPQLGLPDTEVMLFAINLAAKAANNSNLFNRKRPYHETCSNQNQEGVRRPLKQQQERDALVFATARNLVSFAHVGEEIQASRSAETESVSELYHEISDRATGPTCRHDAYNNDIETKAQKRKRKEEKRKRRDRKLEKAREKQEKRVEREVAEQAQSKRLLERTVSEISRERTMALAAETLSIECIESGERDILLYESNRKRQRIDEFIESETGIQRGESLKKPCQQMIPEKCSDTHVSRPQSLRLPFDTKQSSNVLISGKTRVSSREQERPSNSTVEQWKEAPLSCCQQAFLREEPIERTATKPRSSALPFRSGVAKHGELHRPLMHGISSTSKEEGSTINSQNEIFGWQPMNVATSHPAAQKNFVSINGVPSPDPIHVLCTESFLETWGDLVCAVTANKWHQCHSGQSLSCLRDIRFIDSPLLDGCGVDLELADRGALLLICTSVLDDETAARDIVVALAELVALDRYVYIYVTQSFNMVDNRRRE
ncbi:hypothetical protein FisN_17Lh214 [Fistulifera solaris]|uniref:Uncharacterized protein n=1 Tax=Fistulifera solaris TaxID=1519565 RepID=A0A1Z5KIQ0_FISSO|nr:hypothetical protein FisN_17Lh214 [Fistulifera solaris]|eukprot:GAX25828.1 hypothetical protein FisN_17Lh214 [Fistulifera solaris]